MTAGHRGLPPEVAPPRPPHVDNAAAFPYIDRARVQGARCMRLLPMLNDLGLRLFADPKSAASLIRRLLIEYGGMHWRDYGLAFGLMAIGAACTALPAFLLGRGIDQGYVYQSYRGIVLVAVALIGVFALKGIAGYGQAVIMARIANHVVAENQKRMFERLLSQSVAFYADRHSTEFAAHLTFGAAASAQLLNLLFNAFGRDLLTLIGLVAVMLYQAPFLSAIVLLVMPPAFFGTRKLIRQARAIVLTQFGGTAEFLQVMQETIQGFRIIKAFNLEDVMRTRVTKSIASVEAASNRMAMVSNSMTPLMEALGGIAVGLVFLYGGYRVLVLGATPGEFVSFIAAFLLAYEPVKRLTRLNIDLHTALPGVQVLFDILDLPDDVPNRGKPDLRIKDGEVEFADVSFSYRAGQPVLRGMSFIADPGKVTAFVGTSGGGKSTIFNLALALYRPEHGTIRLDGQSYSDVSVESIRRAIAYVSQDIFLFNGTIWQNIALGRPTATESEILAAARAAHADEFVSRFPLGYRTLVGEHGTQLSTGQRQRIAIARALVRDAPVILLDEPTSALDAESENYVRESMAELIRGRTTLVIAHRLHTITQASMIHVVENGAIVESGRHEALMAQGNRYARFYETTFAVELAGGSQTAPRHSPAL
jgi:ABC-type multidrug transport system fused ATPase/permease subunit